MSTFYDDRESELVNEIKRLNKVIIELEKALAGYYHKTQKEISKPPESKIEDILDRAWEDLGNLMNPSKNEP